MWCIFPLPPQVLIVHGLTDVIFEPCNLPVGSQQYRHHPRMCMQYYNYFTHKMKNEVIL